jgi:hypothetical protein
VFFYENTEYFANGQSKENRTTTGVVMRFLLYALLLYPASRHALVRLSFSSQVEGCCYAPKKEQQVILENGC